MAKGNASKGTTTTTTKEASMYIKITRKHIVLRTDEPEGAKIFSPLKPEGITTLLDFMEYFLLGDKKDTRATSLNGRIDHVLKRVEKEGTDTPQYLYILQYLRAGKRASISRKSHLYEPLKGVMLP